MRVVRVVVVAVVLLIAGSAVAQAAPRPAASLAVTGGRVTPAAVPAGGWVQLFVNVRTRGRATAYALSSTLVLSADSTLDRGDTDLCAKPIRVVRHGHTRTVEFWAQLPASTTAGAWQLVTCVRGSSVAGTRSTVRACGAVPVTVGSAAPNPVGPTPVDPRSVDRDGDGVSELAGDCAPTDPTRFPGATDLPDASAIDQDCDGIDGTRTAAIFVAPTGSDAAAGTPGAPLQTLAAAIPAAAAAGKDVYVAAGSYAAGTGLTLQTGVSIYGGYTAGAWARPDAAPTTITGSGTAFIASGATDVTLQQLRIHATAQAVPGASVVTLDLGGASDLVLEDTQVTAAAGGNAGSGGAGGIGGSGGGGGFGGTSTAISIGGTSTLLLRGTTVVTSGAGGAGGDGGDGGVGPDAGPASPAGPGGRGGDGGDGGTSIGIQVGTSATLRLQGTTTLTAGNGGAGGLGGRGGRGGSGIGLGTAGAVGGRGGDGGNGGDSGTALFVVGGGAVTGTPTTSTDGTSGAGGAGGNGGNGGNGLGGAGFAGTTGSTGFGQLRGLGGVGGAGGPA